jgi:putative ATP-binding cassette transporter
LLGEVTPAAAAFAAVQAAFNWLVDNYPQLAEWTSSASRVGMLLLALDRQDARGSAPTQAVTSVPSASLER